MFSELPQWMLSQWLTVDTDYLGSEMASSAGYSPLSPR